jgi:hypothetical protein
MRASPPGLPPCGDLILELAPPGRAGYGQAAPAAYGFRSMHEVTLWHGTTKSAAERLGVEGFRRIDAHQEMAKTVHDFGADLGEVLDALRRMGRFVLTQENRSGSAWFAASREKAAGWAQRAPEARWEALWAIWVARHGAGPDGAAPWGEPMAAAWHMLQLLPDPPAIVEVRVPANRLQDQRQQPISAERLDDYLRLIGDRLVPEVSTAHPVPREWIRGLGSRDVVVGPGRWPTPLVGRHWSGRDTPTTDRSTRSVLIGAAGVA